MKKRFLIYMFLIVFSSCAFCAQYKINSSGKVTSPTGKVQQKSSVISTPVNIYNNYNPDNYVQNKVVQEGGFKTIDIVMDYSGSMYYWIEAAKRAMTLIVSQIPQNVNTGFRIFGNDNGQNPYDPVLSKVKNVVKSKNGKYSVTTEKTTYLGKMTASCSATSSLAPVAPLNSTYLLQKMNATKTGGMTPMVLALKQAVDIDFSKLDNVNKKKIILITDGDENCGGDPCAFARDLVSKRNDIVIDVVLVSSGSRELRCLTSATGGKIYTPADTSEFINSITNSIQNTETTNTQTEQNQQYEFDGE